MPADASRPLQALDERPVLAVRAIVRIAREFEDVCRELGLSLSQYRLMLFVRHGPRRAGELAAQAAIKRPTLTAIVDGLERQGRLRRVRVESDRRAVDLELTPAGLRAMRQLETRLADLMDMLCLGGDHDGMLDALAELSTLVDREVERRTADDA